MTLKQVVLMHVLFSSCKYILYLFLQLENLVSKQNEDSDRCVEMCRVLYQVKVKERNRAVLSGFVDLNRLNSSL